MSAVHADPFRLDGKLALVTGVNRGIGLAIAEALAAAGANILGVSANLSDDGGEAAVRIRAQGRSFVGRRCDLGDRDALAELLDELAHWSDPVDVLVNNAGSIYRSPAEHYPLAEWDRLLEVNLTSQFALAQTVGARMLERGEGRIIFTSSLLAFQGGINVAAYTASKSAVDGVVKALSNEWAARGVNVNAIAPGYVITDNTSALRADGARSSAITDRIPAGRWATPEDIGGAAVFLASPAAGYITGVTLPVDGGWLGR